ncbi:glycosyltransferase family A protein [Mesorhizobium sp.]|uniref:glycosyltransferase family 2 protein n=1 Tax=Mesorhizobium sp. TaxID=1871066 RepID=UPI00263559B9|nr:glycosyltransferase family A protein [Mesorhizobium sp.]
MSLIGAVVIEADECQPADKVPKGMADVAVVIPYYNGSKYIRRAVESVLKQTIKPTEFLVVNDGSKPEEARFLRDLSAEISFAVLDKENGGQGSARNAGVAATKSPYICLLDQDDFFLPNHIEILRKAVKNDDRFGWAYADLMEADGEGRIVRSSMVKAHTTHPKTDVFKMLSEDMFVLPSASIISRRAFEEVEGFDPQFMGYEDDDLFLRMFRAGFTNIFIDKPVSVWCINPESTSYSIRMSRSRWRFLKKVYTDFPSDPIRSRYVMRDLLIPRFNRAIVGEAFQAVIRPTSYRGKTLAPHADELLTILKEYKNLVLGEEWVGWRTKLKISAQTALISTRSRLLNEAALGCAFVFRKISERL